MIILNYLLYACQQCIVRSEGQKCEHHQDQLFSIQKVKCCTAPINYKNIPNLKYCQPLVGKYRLMIKNISIVEETIELSKHLDEEVLFNKKLCVDVTKSVGKNTFILGKTTPVVICSGKEYLDTKFLIPFGDNNNSLLDYGGGVGSTSDLFGLSLDPELDEPVKIRPLSRKAINNCGLLETFKNDSSSETITDEEIDANQVTPQEPTQLQLEPNEEEPSNTKLANFDRFLTDTEQFLQQFCVDIDDDEVVEAKQY